jgi:hypothetical protein
MFRAPPRATMDGVTEYLVEIRMNGAGAPELERAARTLGAASARLQQAGRLGSTVRTPLRIEGDRLVCTVTAPTPDEVRRLLGAALLPPATIRESSDY